MADLYFGLLMPLIGLMKSEFVLIDQLLKDVRYGFLFEIDRTLIWWIVFMNCIMPMPNVFADRIPRYCT